METPKHEFLFEIRANNNLQHLGTIGFLCQPLASVKLTLMKRLAALLLLALFVNDVVIDSFESFSETSSKVQVCQTTGCSTHFVNPQPTVARVVMNSSVIRFKEQIVLSRLIARSLFRPPKVLA